MAFQNNKTSAMAYLCTALIKAAITNIILSYSTNNQRFISFMMNSAEIRQQFMDFFRSRGHVIIPSAPIVIKNDPTLLFTNAGMNQFKEYFLGNKKAPYLRVADTQKCLRVSGKHNDLEEVGVDTYHHTMFEMLGNWSFGDYFKKEAIAWSWELLTEVYKLDKNRLYVTVFEGDTKENLPKDEEAYTEWKKWIGEDRILLGNKKDNFWEMGDTGPCGPCTEIHVDCRSGEEIQSIAGRNLVNMDHPEVIEIWNNVFIQFNRRKDGGLEPLPEKHVDTGMGFERLVRILQDRKSNYDTDIFTGTIAAIERFTGKQYGNRAERRDIAFRVLADHIRAIAFTIADGQLPSNTGAGYVIRRILRRAVRYYYSYLERDSPLLYLLIPLLADQFKDVFPELRKQQEFVARVIQEEETGFLHTIVSGLKRIESITGSLTGPGNLDGETAFELNDTYGFPLDLTKLILSEKGWTVDEEAFGKALEKQKSRSRSATALETEDWVVLDPQGFREFVGYDTLEIKSRILQYRKVRAKGKTAFQVVLSATPFYAESGGQVGDRGELIIAGESVAVTDTRKENNLILHYIDRLPENPGGEVLARVDAERRKQTAIQHTATHLLHAALRKVLGQHVTQKGSLVNEKHLRFDFSHFSPLSREEIKKVEELVNERIRENIPVVIREMHKDDALRLGAMALFGEKYGEMVRVVIIDPGYSVELCGGTHVGRTGDLGFFLVTLETAVAAGVRRIEGKAGRPAFDYLQEDFITPMEELCSLSKKKSGETAASFKNLQFENAVLKKQIEHLEARQLVVIRNELLHKDIIINQVNFIGSMVEVPGADALKKLCTDLKNHLRDYVLLLCANIDGKPYVALCIAENVAAARGLDAGKIIKEYIAPLIKGGGGGQQTMATAGGSDPAGLPRVIERVKALLA
jgi:alanyl-tRNA synthetase